MSIDDQVKSNGACGNPLKAAVMWKSLFFVTVVVVVVVAAVVVFCSI